jgi:hypothetical protein
MEEPMTQTQWHRFRPTAYVAIIGSVIFILVAFAHPDIVFLFDIAFALLLTVVSIGSIVWMIQETIAKRYQQLLPTIAMLAVLWVTLLSLFFYERSHPFELHETAKWVTRSQSYKSAVLARQESTTELKHIEWDMSGFAGIADNTVYLVFDPADKLSTAAKSREPGKFDGIPCEVRLVRRLESDWYAVLFYTDQYWGACK